MTEAELEERHKAMVTGVTELFTSIPPRKREALLATSQRLATLAEKGLVAAYLLEWLWTEVKGQFALEAPKSVQVRTCLDFFASDTRHEDAAFGQDG